MENLARKLNGSAMYFTENPVNYSDAYDGCRYFLCWQNTHKIYAGYKTQAECIEGLEEIIDQKVVYDGSVGFKVVQ
jgi:hypothetical protein